MVLSFPIHKLSIYCNSDLLQKGSYFWYVGADNTQEKTEQYLRRWQRLY